MIFWRIAGVLALLEIFVLAAVIGEIGFFTTLGLWILSAMVGGWLMQEQGIAALTRAQTSFKRGVFPADEMFESLCLFAAGALLILPGFIGDVIAFALLAPQFRNLLRSKGGKPFGLKEENFRPRDDGVIDGVYERVAEKPEQIAPKSQEN